MSISHPSAIITIAVAVLGASVLAAGCDADAPVAATEGANEPGLTVAPQAPAAPDGGDDDDDAGEGESVRSADRVPPPPRPPETCTQAIAEPASEPQVRHDVVVPARHRSAVSLRDRLASVPAHDRVPPEPPSGDR